MAARRQRRRKPSRKERQKQPRTRHRGPYVDDDTYGRIPLIECEVTLPDGSVEHYLDYDPDYKPPLPAGAVRGNIRRQLYGLTTPRYFYEPIDRVCVQCGEDFVFRAKEQKFWFETLQFNPWSKAIRCVRCRKQQRSKKALHHALESALLAVREAPDDAAQQLALAEATVALAERTGHGDIDRGLAAARQALRLDDRLVEAHYWEARLHACAGRKGRAKASYKAFIGLADARGRLRRLVKDAQGRA